MKKLLLVSTAIAGVAAFAAPASAALKMDLGGYFLGYGVYADNNEVGGAGADLHKFEFRRDNEVHVNGEATLDNGLTVGAHTELKIAPGTNAVNTDETYAYASGGWGRVNLGSEDGAAYLLQVAAPSADSNVDGMRTYIGALSPRTANNANAGFSGVLAGSSLFNNNDYQQADFRQTDRLTYLTPKLNGFQGGVSYAPKPGFAVGNGAPTVDNSVSGTYDASATTSVPAVYKNLWEVAARWDGEFQGVAGSVGAGYSDSSLNSNGDVNTVNNLGGANNNTLGDYALTDGLKTWNVGANLSTAGFSLGGGYKLSKTTRVTDSDAGAGVAASNDGDIKSTTWVVGLGYDNGPYHVGGSYLHNKLEAEALHGTGGLADIAATEYNTTKYTVGGGYSYGPGMTFRGSVAWGKFDPNTTSAASNRFTQVAVGTDVQF